MTRKCQMKDHRPTHDTARKPETQFTDTNTTARIQLMLKQPDMITPVNPQMSRDM